MEDVKQALAEVTQAGMVRCRLSDLDAFVGTRVPTWLQATPGSRKAQLRRILISLGWIQSWTTLEGRNTRVWRSP